jgi:hypothetical protein
LVVIFRMGMKATLPQALEHETQDLQGSVLTALLGTNSHTKTELTNNTEIPVPGTLVGTLIGLDPSGLPLVDFPGNPESAPIKARHACSVSASDVKRETVLVFEKSDLRKPIVIGFIQPALPQDAGRKSRPVEATVDGERVTLEANTEIVLRCGKASLTLTRAGKVLITGEYLLSRSNGVNRIKGGSVQIN